VKIIDCTLRDGGYWLNWNWPTSTFNAIYEATSKVCDLVEIGYHTPKHKTRNALDLSRMPKTCFMVDGKDYIESADSFASVIPVRYAIKESEFEKAKIDFKRHPVERKFFNLMYMHFVSDGRLVEIAKWVGKQNVEAFYMADSFGMMYSDGLRHAYELVKDYVPAVGIHLHNNDGKANQKLWDCAEIGYDWADTSLLGMGRGAGNACTELLVPADVPKDMFIMFDHYRWGPSPAYHSAALLGIHPMYVHGGVSKEGLSLIPEQNRRSFDVEVCRHYSSKV